MNIGSAWKKESKDGKKYMSCVMQSPFLPDGQITFAIFPVAAEDKKSDNSPDYVLVWNKPKPKQAQSSDGATSAQGDDDIPF
jgi:uncharacterized protein (DUF736 family)